MLTSRLLPRFLSLALMFWLSSVAAQQDALRVLLGPLAEAPGGASLSGSSADTQVQRMQVTVRRGESLNAVIRRTFPDTPYKDDVVRRAFVQFNPSALARGRLLAGTVLQVPTAQDLRLMVDGSQPRAPEAAAPAQTGVSRAVEDERRKWVRFP